MSAAGQAEPHRGGRLARWTRAHGLAVATILVAVSPYAALDLPWVNVDEFTTRAFHVDFAASFGKMLSGDATTGRFRPLYWLLTGIGGAFGGDSATFLVWFRLLFLGANVWLMLRIAERLGAPRWAASLLAIAAAWSRPALAVWPHGGPAEAVANPLALACTLLLLRAEGTRAVLAAAGIGLAAALVKEPTGAWTATALAVFALNRWLRGVRGAPVAAAAAGVAAQFLPSLVAWRLGSSYVTHVATALRASVGQTALFALDHELLAVLLCAAALPLLVAPLLRPPREWPLEEAMLLGLLLSSLALTFAFGFVMPRYHLPLATAALLCAARGARWLAGPPRPRWWAWGVAALLVTANLGGAARAAVETHTLYRGREAHVRLRNLLRQGIERYGSARLYWDPEQIEVAVGALEHLRIEGLRAPVELVPCYPPAPASADLLLSLFREHSVPAPRWTIALAHYGCTGGRAPSLEQECHLQLPGIRGLRPRYVCWPVPELASVVFAP